MNVLDFAATLQTALAHLEDSAEELRALDAAIGDGDLGITVQSGARAVEVALGKLDESASLSTLLRVSASEFASANPSTFSALIAAGLLAGAKDVEGRTQVGREESLAILVALTNTIMIRGKTALGDKTIVDALHPTIAIMESAHLPVAGVLSAMIVSVENSIEQSKDWISRKGRAAWVGERTIGHRDGGQTAYLRFLQALDSAFQEQIQ